MGIQITRHDEGVEVVPAADHHGVSPHRLHGGEVDPGQGLVLTRSEFAAGAVVDPGPVALATVYLVLDGQVAITTEQGVSTLSAGDSAHLTAGTVRGIAADDGATVLVVRSR